MISGLVSVFILGIACIALSFVDSEGRPLQVPAQDGTSPLKGGDSSAISLDPDQFESLTTVAKVGPSHSQVPGELQWSGHDEKQNCTCKSHCISYCFICSICFRGGIVVTFLNARINTT